MTDPYGVHHGGYGAVGGIPIAAPTVMYALPPGHHPHLYSAHPSGLPIIHTSAAAIHDDGGDYGGDTGGPPYPRPKGRGKKNCRWDYELGQWITLAADAIELEEEAESPPVVTIGDKPAIKVRASGWCASAGSC